MVTAARVQLRWLNRDQVMQIKQLGGGENYTVFHKKGTSGERGHPSPRPTRLASTVPRSSRLRSSTFVPPKRNFWIRHWPDKTKKWHKTAYRLLQCVLLNRLFQTFAESRSLFHSFLSQLVRKFFQQSSGKKYFTFIMGFYQKVIFELNMVNFSMWTKVKLSWFATCQNYDVIKQLSK